MLLLSLLLTLAAGATPGNGQSDTAQACRGNGHTQNGRADGTPSPTPASASATPPRAARSDLRLDRVCREFVGGATHYILQRDFHVTNIGSGPATGTRRLEVQLARHPLGGV